MVLLSAFRKLVNSVDVDLKNIPYPFFGFFLFTIMHFFFRATVDNIRRFIDIKSCKIFLFTIRCYEFCMLFFSFFIIY